MLYSFCLTFVFFLLLKHTIIPRGSLSLKVLAELPIIVVLMYQVSNLLLIFLLDQIKNSETVAAFTWTKVIRIEKPPTNQTMSGTTNVRNLFYIPIIVWMFIRKYESDQQMMERSFRPHPWNWTQWTGVRCLRWNNAFTCFPLSFSALQAEHP